jgi:peptide/nickel transport system permease protein
MRWVLRRLAFYLAAAWVALTLNFAIPRMMPGDPATALVARFQGELQPEAIDALREAFGFTDAPLWEQYLVYLGHLASGDLGISVSYFPAPVASVIATGLLWTIVLAGTAVLVSFGLGTVLGAWSAWRRHSLLGSALPPVFALLGAFPYFWLAMLALWTLGFGLGAFPLRHAHGEGVEPGWNIAFVSSAARHAVLPATTIVIATLGGWLLAMRNNMISVLGESYITMAQAKGLSQLRVLTHYAARNALLPSVTGFGMALGFVLSGSLLTEIVFAYPGQGYLLVQAVRNQDFPLLQGLFLTITLAVLCANLLVDIAYAWLDPRTSARAQQ